MKYCFIFIFVTTLACLVSPGQEDTAFVLNLADTARKIENVIKMDISKYDYEDIQTIPGQKVDIDILMLIINGDTLKPREVNIRGQSTLYFRRKSFSFSLESEAVFRHRKNKESLKKFNALSLSMDQGYCCNRLAFEMMEEAKLFDLFYTFCDLRINNRSEGIYMIVERPEDWALKKKDSPLLIRRGFKNSIDKIMTGKKIEKEEEKKYKGYFNQIYRSVSRYDGEEFYNTVSELMDIDLYMKWLAFNFFVRNGDYTDELWFYIDHNAQKYSIIPWDYDDLFSAYPHEGRNEYRKVQGDKLFFSTEDFLDKKIVSDPYLYNKYLVQLRDLLNQLTPGFIKRTFEKTYAELYPYYSDHEIISMSQYDLHKEMNTEQLKKDLAAFYQQLVVYRDVYLRELEDGIK